MSGEIDFPAGKDEPHGVRAELMGCGVWLNTYDTGQSSGMQDTIMGFDEAEKLADWIKAQVAIGRAALSTPVEG